MRDFYYNGYLMTFVKEEDGWRYYEGEGVKIRCKGMKVEIWQ